MLKSNSTASTSQLAVDLRQGHWLGVKGSEMEQCSLPPGENSQWVVQRISTTCVWVWCVWYVCVCVCGVCGGVGVSVCVGGVCGYEWCMSWV